ncbi:expressed unknown protein [Ectocarpus siliculosus]|uniref:Uncharacterized protein n=1 Tax=Ectocarpus siliculosus TaxID=2880 RepID=D7G0G6_ECTSI|nr:expressed unknown protein [Ectocarpus siliculosus]|eukprot:CBJ32995.1 expressed unknown protein [Ectocarpus siliculosus]
MAAPSSTATPAPAAAATGPSPSKAIVDALVYVQEVVAGAAMLLQEMPAEVVPILGTVCKTFLAFEQLAETAKSNREALSMLQDLCKSVVNGVLDSRKERPSILKEGFAQLQEQVDKAVEVAKLCNGSCMRRLLWARKIRNDIAGIRADVLAYCAVINLVLADDIHANLADTQAAVANTQATVADTQATVADTQATVADTHATVADTHATVADTQAKVEQIATDLDDKLEEMTRLAKTQAGYEAMQTEMEALKDELEAMGKKVESNDKLEAEREKKELLGAMERAMERALEARVQGVEQLKDAQNTLGAMEEGVASERKAPEDRNKEPETKHQISQDLDDILQTALEEVEITMANARDATSGMLGVPAAVSEKYLAPLVSAAKEARLAGSTSPKAQELLAAVDEDQIGAHAVGAKDRVVAAVETTLADINDAAANISLR